jgi:hypothetical protein
MLLNNSALAVINVDASVAGDVTPNMGPDSINNGNPSEAPSMIGSYEYNL